MLIPVMKTSDWMESAFNDFFGTPQLRRVSSTAPAVNVREDGKAYIMEMAVPGIKKEYVRVAINEEGNLDVAIENKFEHKEEDGKESRGMRYLRREFSYANYRQAYGLPDDVDRERIAAKVADGVLTITLPKRVKEAAGAGRRIAVE